LSASNDPLEAVVAKAKAASSAAAASAVTSLDAAASAAPRDPLRTLCLAARLHQVAAQPEALRHTQGLGASDAVTDQALLLAARSLGLKAKLATTSVARIAQLALPALVKTHDGRWLLLAQVSTEPGRERVLLQDAELSPDDAGNRPQIQPLADFAAQWSGTTMLLASRASLTGALAKFDFTWFVPSIVRHRKLLLEVLAVSACLQLFALVSPLFFQVVMDKVLVNRTTSTLNVLVVGLLVVVVFESLLSVLRTYVFSHTTSRIDVELGSRLFKHLLALPLAYFQARRVGDSVARVRELENIRNFLTGQSLTLVLDVVFSVVFIAVMFLYSVPLTLIVLASIPLYVGLSLMVVPVLRRRLDEKFARGAENQAMLVEAISGVQTVKASALEPQLARRWDQQLAAYVAASFKTSTLASGAHEAVGLVGKLVSAATLWYGAHLVMDNQLTVGMFVAFNMFAQRVAQPIMRMAQMWTDFQQTGISMARLGDILNTRTEVPPSSAVQLPTVQGHIQFDAVRFRYRPEAQPALEGLSLDIEAGQMLGIVGRSGSGKSTLTKLVQRLYTPEAGRVLIDGVDISLIDAAQLRRQIGVVLQDNWLFNRSVRENIAVADPAAPIEAVMHAAKLAGAHEFISALPEGYDTTVGEQGASLSGGQRQRIAIARALFTNPRILIFDEATSALDYESEAIIQRNMAAIAQGRTVIVIAHRLSAVRHAHRIVVMERGAIVESGTHASLVRQPQGAYARLWALQSEHGGVA
jgi:ATP-binding cassette, subfamily B, bacterial HlyB/CyaB